MTSAFLSSAATTPHEFIITGDFNIHLDNPADTFTSQFLSLLSYFNLSQHVHFPTHDKNHILDLVIPLLTRHLLRLFLAPIGLHPTTFLYSPTVYKPNTTPPPTLHSSRRLHFIDVGFFLTDLKFSAYFEPPSAMLKTSGNVLTLLLTGPP